MSGRSSKTNSVQLCLPSIGPTPSASKTSAPSEPSASLMSISSAEDPPAKTCLSQVEEWALQEADRVFGASMRGSLVSYDPDSSSWKTFLGCSMLPGVASVPFSGRWPASGTMRGGVVSELSTSTPRIDGTESLSSRGWTTPCASDAEGTTGGGQARSLRGGYEMANCNLRGEQQPRRSESEERRRTGNRGEAMRNANGARLEEHESRNAGQCQTTLGDSTESRTAQSSVGGAAYGVPGLVDRWPAGRGEDQHPWEAPRTAYGVRHRTERIRALGNAVVPQVAYAIGRLVVEINRRISPTSHQHAQV